MFALTNSYIVPYNVFMWDAYFFWIYIVTLVQCFETTPSTLNENTSYVIKGLVINLIMLFAPTPSTTRSKNKDKYPPSTSYNINIHIKLVVQICDFITIQTNIIRLNHNFFNGIWLIWIIFSTMDHVELSLQCFKRFFFMPSCLNKKIKLSKLVIDLPPISKCKTMMNWTSFCLSSFPFHFVTSCTRLDPRAILT
jgi:hypothetical protein